MSPLDRSSDAWRVAPGLIWKQFSDSDNWVVYHPGSGDVHLMSPSARDLWALIESGQARTVPDLFAALRSRSDEPDERLAQSIRSVLRTMDDAGLIDPADA